MNSGAMLLASSGLAFAGWGALSLAMARHWQQALGGHPASPGIRRGLRVLGGLLLGASLAVCLSGRGIGPALAHWFAALNLGGLAVVLLLSYAANKFHRACRSKAALPVSGHAGQAREVHRTQPARRCFGPANLGRKSDET